VSATSTEQRVGALLERYRGAVNDGLRAALSRPGVEHARYMRYHFGWEDFDGAPLDAPAGKMLRPALCMLCCEAAGGNARRALAAAVAIELLHNFSLIHDDIEDNSDTRHGRPALWRAAGIPQAINAGDGMFVLAQRTLLDLADAGVPPERVLDAARRLNDACIALCEGQHRDIAFEGRATVSLAEYEAMIGGKTAALLSAAAAIGAVAAGAPAATVEALGECGRLLGLAFQVQDDVLGAWGDPRVTGKSAADDIRMKKKAFPAVYALEHLDADGRERLLALYAQPSLPDADVAAVLDLFERAGARDGAGAAARAYAGAALAAIRETDLEPERRADIAALAEFFVDRSS